jgi:hypothetical protein
MLHGTRGSLNTYIPVPTAWIHRVAGMLLAHFPANGDRIDIRRL